MKILKNGLFNIRNGIVKKGSIVGGGNQIGKVNDFLIKGMEKEQEAEMVACYHFFVKKII